MQVDHFNDEIYSQIRLFRFWALKMLKTRVLCRAFWACSKPCTKHDCSKPCPPWRMQASANNLILNQELWTSSSLEGLFTNVVSVGASGVNVLVALGVGLEFGTDRSPELLSMRGAAEESPAAEWPSGCSAAGLRTEGCSRSFFSNEGSSKEAGGTSGSSNPVPSPAQSM